jgi:hypothetical protein
MINLYVNSTQDQEGIEALMRWSQEKEVALYFADINEDAKTAIATYNLNNLPILVDIGHKQDDQSGEITCTQLAVGVNAILAYTL